VIPTTTTLRRSARTVPPKPKTVRVAIYTRKSTEDGLDQEFNSLDAQRQAVEAYVESQRGQGWVTLTEHYDDGGFSGATTERPAFQRLLKDVEDGKVDAVAVYKIDRLSRSLLDFTLLMQLFERKGVTFLSVTQQFSTATSVGRMTLNLLATFAQFERETIAERTRDKMAASRRRGLWVGGRPILGYDVVDKHLVVNPLEAERVRAMFAMYLERGSLLAVVEELRRRGWKNKTWVNQQGATVEGLFFNKTTLRYSLTNPLYIGQIRLRDEQFSGAHEAIIEEGVWHAVQARIQSPPLHRAGVTRNRWDVLLQGLVRCGACGGRMTHHYSSRGTRRYSYYVCSTAQKHGAAICRGSRIATAELDRFVERRLRASRASGGDEGVAVADAEDLQRSQAHVDAVWGTLSPRDRPKLVNHLIEEVVFDARNDDVSITYRPNGLETWMEVIRSPP
jgi:site-specific DNA recombinase